MRVSNGKSRDRSNSRGDATRELILATAERLFAERGIAAVPLREIGIVAGQKNNVVVQYHFGDRENLVRAIASSRAQFVEEMAVELAAEMASDRATLTIGRFVRSFVLSLATNIEEGNYYLPFLSRYITERGGYAGLEHAVPASAVDTLSSIIRQLLPNLSEIVIDVRWEVLMTSAVHTLASYQTALKLGALPAPLDRLLDDLVTFLTAGLEAPSQLRAGANAR